MSDNYLLESLSRYTGQTVTIFTTSGGCSGAGFTGVLASVNENCVRLITNIGAPPSCPLGSSYTGFNNYSNYGYGGYNWLGSVTEIPICKIASFTHNAI